MPHQSRSFISIPARLVALLLATLASCGWWSCCHALIPLIDGGKTIPKLYKCYFDSQLAKQASTAVGKAVAAGKTKIEVYFSPVYVRTGWLLTVLPLACMDGALDWLDCLLVCFRSRRRRGALLPLMIAMPLLLLPYTMNSAAPTWMKCDSALH
jgi:hypothetical protein